MKAPTWFGPAVVICVVLGLVGVLFTVLYIETKEVHTLHHKYFEKRVRIGGNKNFVGICTGIEGSSMLRVLILSTPPIIVLVPASAVTIEVE